MRNLITIMLTTCLIVSCSDDNESDVKITNLQVGADQFETLRGSWELERIESRSNEQTILPPSKVTLSFESDPNEEFVYFLEGNAICNQYGGELKKLLVSEIELVNLYATEKLCQEVQSNEFETKYFEILFQMTEYQRIEDTLVLSNNSNTLIFNTLKD